MNDVVPTTFWKMPLDDLLTAVGHELLMCPIAIIDVAQIMCQLSPFDNESRLSLQRIELQATALADYIRRFIFADNSLLSTRTARSLNSLSHTESDNDEIWVYLWPIKDVIGRIVSEMHALGAAIEQDDAYFRKHHYDTLPEQFRPVYDLVQQNVARFFHRLQIYVDEILTARFQQ